LFARPKEILDDAFGYFTPSPEVEVGIMCAAPKGNGFEAKFDNLKLGS